MPANRCYGRFQENWGEGAGLNSAAELWKICRSVQLSRNPTATQPPMPPLLPPRNPLPQLTPSRVRQAPGGGSQPRIWTARTPLEVFVSEEQSLEVGIEEAMGLPLKPLVSGDRFGRGGDNWTSHWMRTVVPAAQPGESGLRHLSWACDGESTVWIDGQAWAGLDLGHSSCPLPDIACDAWIECCNWQTGIWISMSDSRGIGPHGLEFEGAELAIRDPHAWECHADLDAIGQVLTAAVRCEPDLHLAATFGYCRALERCFSQIAAIIGGS